MPLGSCLDLGTGVRVGRWSHDQGVVEDIARSIHDGWVNRSQICDDSHDIGAIPPSTRIPEPICRVVPVLQCIEGRMGS